MKPSRLYLLVSAALAGLLCWMLAGAEISSIPLARVGIVTHCESDTNPVPMSATLTIYEPKGVPAKPTQADPMIPPFVPNLRVIGTNEPPGVTNNLVLYFPPPAGKLPLFDVWGVTKFPATTNVWKTKTVIFSNLQYGSTSPPYSTTNAPAMWFKGVRHQ